MNPNNFNVLAWKANVLAVSTDPVNIHTIIFPTIDGIQTVYDDRILLKDQIDPLENGIYRVDPIGHLMLDFDCRFFMSYTYGASVRVISGVIGRFTEWYIAPIKTQQYQTTPKYWIQSPFSNGNALDVKGSVRVASTVNISITSALINGSVIDGVTVVTGDRVLLKNQTIGSENGIYDVVVTGIALRSIDANTNVKVTSGMYTFVSEGMSNASNGYVLTTPSTIILGTTVLTFTQFSGAGQITAGTGLTKNGNTIDVVGTTNRIIVNTDNIDIASSYVGQTSITSLGTITIGVWNGTAITNANLSNIIRNTGIISPPALTVDENNYNPSGLSTTNVIRLDATTNIIINGLLAQESGRRIIIFNISSFKITLSNNTTSIAANRFLLDANIILGSNESCELWYDIISIRWRIISRF